MNLNTGLIQKVVPSLYACDTHISAFSKHVSPRWIQIFKNSSSSKLDKCLLAPLSPDYQHDVIGVTCEEN
jgi:hypothetical protein